MQTPAVVGKRSAARVASAAPRLWPLNQTVRDAASGVSFSTSGVQTRSSASRNPSWTEPCVARHQGEAGVVERIPEPIRLGAAEGDDDGARHRGDVRLRVAALDELGRQAGGGEALPRLVRIPVGEQRRFGEPPGVGSRHRRGARVERHGLVAVEVAIAGVGLGMEDEPKVGNGARSLHG